MHDNGFDALSRAVALRVTRRNVIKGALGVSGAGFVTSAVQQRSYSQDIETPTEFVAESPTETPTPASASLHEPDPTVRSRAPRVRATVQPTPTTSDEVSIAATAVPRVSLSPTSGAVASNVRATLSGFTRRERITLKWYNGSSAKTLGTVTASTSGQATFSFKAVDSARGSHKVTATGSASSKAESTFTITPRLVLSSSSGRSGTKTTVSLTGFAASKTLELRWFVGTSSSGTSTILTTVSSSSLGNAKKTIMVPLGASNGAHRIEARERGGSAKAAATFTITPVNLSQQLAVPAYFEPGALWTKLDDGAPAVGLAVMNPNSGPGTVRSQEYIDQVRRSQDAGITILGYVSTRYGERSLTSVIKEVDRYYNWYGVDGIFFDEASTECDLAADYYQPLYDHVKAKGGPAVVALNPGTSTNECYMTVADIVLTFEDSATQYESFVLEGWESKYAPDRFWHLVYAAPNAAAMRTALANSKQRRAGWVYITPDKLPNPWDSLPGSYWSAELDGL